MKQAIPLSDLAGLLVKGGKEKDLLEHVKKTVSGEKLDVNSLRKKLHLVALKFQKLWRVARRDRKRFLENNDVWLSGEFKVDILCPSKASVGRPSKSFKNLSRKSKKNRIKSLRNQFSQDEIDFAAASSVTSAGFHNAGKLVTKLLQKPETAIELQGSADQPKCTFEALTAEEALAFLCKNGFSKAQYMDIRQMNISKGVDMYPSYSKLIEAKKLCYPTGLSIRSSTAEVPLQDLVEHTTKRLFQSVMTRGTFQNVVTYDEYTLIYKWGCDGSSNHARYKQTFFDEDEDKELREYNDSHIFAFSVVPLRIIGHRKSESTQEIVWNNDLPSSISLCRPIKLIFAKENAELTKREVQIMETQIQSLKQVELTFDNRVVFAKPEMLFTMMDTKVVNDLTGTNSQACYICDRSGKSLNNPRSSPDSDDPGKYKYGFSPLHAYIRAMEMVLKISYRLVLDKPTWRVSKLNEAVKGREMEIRKKFRVELGLRISEPVPAGGNSNDGNTARKFFREWKTTAKITNLDEDLLERFHVLLTVINSKSHINHSSYEIYAEQTRALYVKLYGWYALSPTVHKLLVHGAAIIKYTVLPIGMCSEEVQETRNKCIRRYREFHARKFSRVVNMEDVFKRLLLTSDPVISLTNRISSITPELILPYNARNLIIEN